MSLRQQELTVTSTVPRDASAHVTVVPLVASCPVVAGVVHALVDRRGAVFASVSRRAGAGVVIKPILARATILTGIGSALVDVVFTVSPGETVLTLTEIRIHEIQTLGTIGARVGAAVIDLLFAVESGVARRTLTEVSAIGVVSAAPTIEAGTVGASHGAQLTVSSVETRRACAAVGVFKISAASTVSTRVAGAFVDLDLTAGSSESGSAGAGVASLAGVGARGPILTWFVMCAVVKILVTEKASPTLLAVALPWLLAGTVQTSGITDAVIAVLSAKSHSAFAFTGFVTKSVVFITACQTDWFSAVLSFPSGVADDFSALPAGKVTECVVAWAAEHRAALAVVMLIADESVRVLEFCPPTNLKILRPFFTHR